MYVVEGLFFFLRKERKTRSRETQRRNQKKKFLSKQQLSCTVSPGPLFQSKAGELGPRIFLTTGGWGQGQDRVKNRALIWPIECQRGLLMRWQESLLCSCFKLQFHIVSFRPRSTDAKKYYLPSVVVSISLVCLGSMTMSTAREKTEVESSVSLLLFIFPNPRFISLLFCPIRFLFFRGCSKQHTLQLQHVIRVSNSGMSILKKVVVREQSLLDTDIETDIWALGITE